MSDRGNPSPFEQLRRQRDASIRRQTDPASIRSVVTRVERGNRRAGFASWDAERLRRNPVGDPGPGYPRLTPPTKVRPRLFISYAWSRDDEGGPFESDLWVDAFAGTLFNKGYDLVFDRDPRNFDKGLNWFQILTRMNDCNFFIPVITDHYAERVSDPGDTGPLAKEWQHALRLYPKFLAIIGIWHSGPALPAALNTANTVDIRAQPAPWGGALDDIFPPAGPGGRGIPRIGAPDRPADPEHWPMFIPY